MELLGQLDQELGRRSVKGRLFVVGRSAIILAHSEDDEGTRDVDATLHPRDEVVSAAAAVARRYSLATDWLNDAARIYLPAPDPSDPAAETVYEGTNVSVSAASAPYVLAMKLRAGRAGRDEKDIELLCRLCGIRDSQDARDLYERFYPEDELKRSSVAILEGVLDDGAR